MITMTKVVIGRLITPLFKAYIQPPKLDKLSSRSLPILLVLIMPAVLFNVAHAETPLTASSAPAADVDGEFLIRFKPNTSYAASVGTDQGQVVITYQ